MNSSVGQDEEWLPVRHQDTGFLLKNRPAGVKNHGAFAGPGRKSRLCPLTRPEQSQAYTHTHTHTHTDTHRQPARGPHHSRGQVGDVTSFLPDLILGLSYALASLIHAEAVCLPVTLGRDHTALSGGDWVLLGI